MGKKRQAEDESLVIERLEKEIRELKSINKSLMRQLKKENRKYKPEFDEDETDVVKEDETNKLRKICTECGRGKITETPLGSRTLIACSVCSYRKSVKQMTSDGESKKEV